MNTRVEICRRDGEWRRYVYMPMLENRSIFVCLILSTDLNTMQSSSPRAYRRWLYREGKLSTLLLEQRSKLLLFLQGLFLPSIEPHTLLFELTFRPAPTCGLHAVLRLSPVRILGK